MQYVFHQFRMCMVVTNFCLLQQCATSIFVAKSIIFYARYIVGAEILLHMFVCVNNLSHLMAMESYISRLWYPSINKQAKATI